MRAQRAKVENSARVTSRELSWCLEKPLQNVEARSSTCVKRIFNIVSRARPTWIFKKRFAIFLTSHLFWGVMVALVEQRWNTNVIKLGSNLSFFVLIISPKNRLSNWLCREQILSLTLRCSE